MRILTEFETFPVLTSSGDAAGYIRTNIADLDPGLVWRADAYAGDVWLKIDFESAKSLTATFFNRANFPQARIQGHASDSWEEPDYNVLVTLGKDEADNRKGYFQLSGFNYRWLRILIPGSQELDSGSVPELGNLIIGTDAATPDCPAAGTNLLSTVDRFEPAGGGVVKRFRGRQYHTIDLEYSGTLAEIKGLPKTWEHAVLWLITDDAGECYLVTRPERWSRPIQNKLACRLKQVFEERA